MGVARGIPVRTLLLRTFCPSCRFRPWLHRWSGCRELCVWLPLLPGGQRGPRPKTYGCRSVNGAGVVYDRWCGHRSVRLFAPDCRGPFRQVWHIDGGPGVMILMYGVVADRCIRSRDRSAGSGQPPELRVGKCFPVGASRHDGESGTGFPAGFSPYPAVKEAVPWAYEVCERPYFFPAIHLELELRVA